MTRCTAQGIPTWYTKQQYGGFYSVINYCCTSTSRGGMFSGAWGSYYVHTYPRSTGSCCLTHVGQSHKLYPRFLGRTSLESSSWMHVIRSVERTQHEYKSYPPQQIHGELLESHATLATLADCCLSQVWQRQQATNEAGSSAEKSILLVYTCCIYEYSVLSCTRDTQASGQEQCGHPNLMVSTWSGTPSPSAPYESRASGCTLQ